MSTTKDRLIDKAKELFNDKGYDNVSLRDIAEACNMSIGNLNYHFKKKEDLVMAIQRGIYDDLYILVSGSSRTLTDIIGKFYQIEHNQLEYPYYFSNILELSRSYEAIEKSQRRFRERLFSYYFKSFLAIRDEGVFRGDLSEEQYRYLAFGLIFHHTLWHENGSPVYDQKFRDMKYKTFLLHTIYPYLTEKGIEQFNQALDDYKDWRRPKRASDGERP